jgi:hypothetical protein
MPQRTQTNARPKRWHWHVIRAQRDIALGKPKWYNLGVGVSDEPPLRETPSDSNDAVLWHPGKLWSLWDMLLNHFPIYEIIVDLQKLRAPADLYIATGMADRPINDLESRQLRALLEKVQRECPPLGLMQTYEIAESISGRPTPETYRVLSIELTHLGDSVGRELKREGIFRIQFERKNYFEQDALFGPKVAAAFPSCAWDIQNAGNCYALGQGDGCVHHLMLVLERGLNALSISLEVPYERINWQVIIQNNASKLKSRGAEFDFHREVNAQFGFLKDAYRNHSEHARDDHYDINRAGSILDHVQRFMQALEAD